MPATSNLKSASLVLEKKTVNYKLHFTICIAYSMWRATEFQTVFALRFRLKAFTCILYSL